MSASNLAMSRSQAWGGTVHSASMRLVWIVVVVLFAKCTASGESPDKIDTATFSATPPPGWELAKQKPGTSFTPDGVINEYLMNPTGWTGSGGRFISIDVYGASPATMAQRRKRL